jgi:hypothetical protein
MPEFEARGRFVRLPAEVRAEGDAIVVEGYAAVFDQETDIGGYFREAIAPGAFADSLGRGDDVVFVYNHDDSTVMARTRSRTLSLEEDSRGLKMRAELAENDPDVQRIYHKMQRGDLDKMSFAFWPERQEWDDTDEVPLRRILQARLHDVSIVTTPAYAGTEIALRSLEDFRRERRAANFSAVRARLRMKQSYLASARENG